MTVVKLVGLTGPLTGKSKLFLEGEYELGRDGLCDIPVDHPTVTTRHAKLVVTESEVFLQDSGSLNGTFVQGARIVRDGLQDRDTFTLGPDVAFGIRVLDLRPAGFWIRFLAAFIDGLVASFGAAIAAFLTGALVGISYSSSGPSSFTEMRTVSGVFGILWGLFGPFLYAVLMNGSKGQTLGKMAVGLKILRSDLSRISYGQAVIRYIMQALLGTLSLGIMYIFLAVRPDKRGWHDLIADTRVVYWKDLQD